MTLVVQETLRILCKALGVDALPAGHVARVEQWTELPGFTVDRFRKLVLATEQRGVTVSSVRYWEGAVADTFRPLPPPRSERQPRLLSARAWPDYLAHQQSHLGSLDAQTVLDLWFRYNSERQVLRLPIEEKWYEKSDAHSLVCGGDPASDPRPDPPGG